MPAPGEFELIRRFFTPSSLPGHVVVGVGDDCAVLQMPPGCELAISVDTQVSGIHFPADTNPALIASRALRCAASDLAAMGAEPLGFTLALTLPTADENWLQVFAGGLQETATQLHCPLIGGDTTRGSLCISVQVHGCVPAGKAIRRSGATVGNQVWVSGSLGDGAAALALIEKQLSISGAEAEYLLHRFYHPDIDFGLGVRLREIASSCIDISDGLLADLGHICAASGVGALIEMAKIPVAMEWRDKVSPQQLAEWALCGGDDYRLCFTAAPQHQAVLQSLAGLCCIGSIVEGCDIVVVDEHGEPYEMHDSSYRHF